MFQEQLHHYRTQIPEALRFLRLERRELSEQLPPATEKENPHLLPDSLPESQQPHKSIHTLWRADILAWRASHDKRFRGSKENLKSALNGDGRHLSMEHHLNMNQIGWTDQVSPQEGILGEGYQESMGAITHNYIDLLAKENADASRAEVEHQVMVEIEKWAVETATDPSQFLVWMSPPSAEYGGTTSEQNWDNDEQFCTMINLKWAEKGRDPKTNKEIISIHSVQLKGWPNYRQLTQIWQELNPGKTLPHTPQTICHDLISNLTPLNRPGKTPQEVINEVAGVLNQYKDSWKFAQEPHLVSEKNFKQNQQLLWNEFYLEYAKPLFQQIPAKLKESDPFWSSEKYQIILDQLDTLFTYYHRALVKWVGENEGQKKIKGIQLEDIKRAYNIDIDVRVFQKKVSRSDQEWHKQQLPILITLINDASGKVQCGTVAAFKSPFEAVAKSFSGGIPMDVFHGFNLESKKTYYQQLVSDNYQEISFIINGKVVYYMVPASYLEGKGCYLDEESQRAMGPCDLPLDDPLEEGIVFKKDKYQFAQYLNTLKQEIEAEEIRKTEQALVEHPDLSATDKEEAVEIIHQIEDMTLRPFITLDEFVSGVTPFNVELYDVLPEHFYDQVIKSRNPLQRLREVLFIMIQKKDAQTEQLIQTVKGNSLRGNQIH